MTRDKKEFIEAILTWFKTPKVGNDEVLDRQFLADAYDNITQPHWISVEDKLPPKKNEYDDLSNNVLATDGKEIYESVYNHDFEDWFTHDMWGLSNITYWMPMPQPPVVSKTENTGKKSNFDENCEKYRTVFDGWEDLTFEERRDRINKFRSGQW